MADRTSPASPATGRWARVVAPPRIVGLDVARALAVFGMIGAHVGVVHDPADGQVDWFDLSTWSALVHGRPSLLFALLAGVSVALMTGRERPPAGEALARARAGLVGRGLVIFGIGLVLELLNTRVIVILTLYGILFVLATVVLTWRPRTLLLTAAGLALLGPPLLRLLLDLTLDPSAAGVGLVLSGAYPITVWSVLLLVGTALGRLGMERTRVAGTAVGVGLLGTVLGPLLALPVTQAPVTWSDGMPAADGWAAQVALRDPVASAWRATWDGSPHSGGLAELLGSGGFALMVLGLCVLLAPRLRLLLVPVAAVGSMPLTAYSAHLLSLVIVQGGPGGSWEDDNALWGWSVVGLLVGCTAWALLWGRGPLERVAARASRALAGRAEAPSAP